MCVEHLKEFWYLMYTYFEILFIELSQEALGIWW